MRDPPSVQPYDTDVALLLDDTDPIPAVPGDTDAEPAPLVDPNPLPLPGPGAPACPASPASSWLEDVTVCAGLGGAVHVLGEPGVATTWYATGQVFGDFDGDTWLDVAVTSFDGMHTQLFLGSPTGLFVPRADIGLLATPASGAAAADVDGDGHLDLFLAGHPQDFLLLNDGSALQRPAFGAPSSPGLGMAGSFADLDLDGDLELLVTNYECPLCGATDMSPCERAGDALFALSPVGWADVTATVLGDDFRHCGLGFMSTFADFDGDGDLDLYVANDKGSGLADDPTRLVRRNTYWRNDGPGCGAACFEEIALTNGSDLRVDAMGIDVGDVDGDLDLDIVVSDGGATRLLRNDGPAFTDITELAGLGVGAPQSGWGVLLLDLDNDGDLDLFTAGTGPDALHLNDGAGQFTDVAGPGLSAESWITYGAAAGDYDRDGRVDVIVGDRGWGYRLLRNTLATPNHWVGLRLVGSGAGGPSAIGARVWVTDTLGRTQVREVKSGSSNGAGSDLGVHFGLGAADALTQVRVRWPDGTDQLVVPLVDRWNVLTR